MKIGIAVRCDGMTVEDEGAMDDRHGLTSGVARGCP